MLTTYTLRLLRLHGFAFDLNVVEPAGAAVATAISSGTAKV